MGLKFPYLAIFGMQFEKAILISEISTSNLSTFKERFMQNKQKINLGPKMPYFANSLLPLAFVSLEEDFGRLLLKIRTVDVLSAAFQTERNFITFPFIVHFEKHILRIVVTRVDSFNV